MIVLKFLKQNTFYKLSIKMSNIRNIVIHRVVGILIKLCRWSTTYKIWLIILGILERIFTG